MEKIDVVDDENNVVGQMDMWEVHRRKLNFRTVVLFLVDSEGRLMLQRRADNMGYMDGRYTLSVTGHVDSGEAPEVAMRREMMEEIGLSVDVKNIGIYKIKLHDLGHTFVTCFVGEYSGEKIVLDEREVQGVAFWELDEIWNDLEKNPEKFIPELPDMLEIYKDWKKISE